MISKSGAGRGLGVAGGRGEGRKTELKYDFLTGQKRQLSPDEFPFPDELIARYKQGAGMNDARQAMMLDPYVLPVP